MGKAKRILFYLEETEAQKVNKTNSWECSQVLGFYCFIAEAKTNESPWLLSSFEVQGMSLWEPTPQASSFEHFCSTDTSMAEQGTVRASRSSWLPAQWCTDQSILNLFLCQSSTFPPSSHLSIFCKATGMACKPEPCIWPRPSGCHPSDWSTHSYNFSIHLQWRHWWKWNSVQSRCWS